MIERLGPYVLDALLGAGGASQVWSAHRDDGRVGPIGVSVAVKVVEGGPVDELVREAEVVRALRHPNIVPVLDVVREGAVVGIVMPLASAGSLADRLVSGPLSNDAGVRLADALAAALVAVHAAGIVHGDVKPANVLFVDPVVPMLADFGVARAIGPSATDDPVAGTVEHLAPEVIDGAPSDPAADVYALGVTLYEALSGRLPYAGPSALATARLADRGEAPPLADAGVDPGLAAVVHRAMARHRDDRFADGAAVRAALRATSIGQRVLGSATSPEAGGRPPVASDTRVFGPRPPLPEPVVPPTWPRVAVAVAAVAALAIGGVLAVGAWRGRTTANAACPVVQPVPADGAELLEGDIDGDGCPDRVVWREPLLSVAPARHQDRARTYEIRAADGQALPDGTSLFLGDWTCAGIDTLGVYDRTTGEIRTFPNWGGPSVGDQLPAPTVTPAQAGATVHLARGDHHTRCDQIVLG